MKPVRLAGLTLPNPVLAASGTFGFGEEYAPWTALSRLGGIVTKSVTWDPLEGNPPPRVVETPAGLLNSIGWQNPGLAVFLREKLPRLAAYGVPIIVNVAGFSLEDYVRVAARLDDAPGVAALELNISCPNVDEGGMAFGTDPRQAGLVTAAVRRVTRLTLVVKLSPNVTDIAVMARAVAEAGADAVSLINTLVGMAMDWRTGRPIFQRVVAGLSGPAVKPVALYQVWQVARAVTLPVIGMGGITTARDALEFFAAGAAAVAVGTANFRRPDACLRVIEGLERYDAEGPQALEGEEEP